MRRARHIDLRREDGFTLTELLISMVFLSVLFTAFAMIMTTTTHIGDSVQEQDTLETEVRAAVDRMAQDLRDAYTGTTSPARIESISGTTVTFYAPDKASPFHDRKIWYRLTGGHLDRNSVTSTDTDGPPWLGLPASAPSTGWATQLASITSTTLLTTVDATGACTTTAATSTAIRSICMTLTVAPLHSSGRRYTYSTTVSLRGT
jgi:prepilin-type N-terminal cleavage/methylation domain-containing protein